MRILRYIFIFLAVNFLCNSLICGEIQSLIFAEESLPQVLCILEKLTEKSILCDQSLANVKLSLQIRQNLSQQDAIHALENVLSMNGVAIIDRGDGVLRAVSTRMAATHATEWLETSALSMAASEKFYTKLFTLEYASVADFAKIIRPILSQVGSSTLIFENSNCLVITDRLSNLQRVELLIKNVDKPRCSKIKSKIFRIKHGSAENISAILHKLISTGDSSTIRKIENKPHEEGTQGKPGNANATAQSDAKTDMQEFKFSGNVAIEHDKYSNSIIVCGTQQDINHIEKIIDGLDILLEQVRIEVVIAQVTLGDDETSGLESLGIAYNCNIPTNVFQTPTSSGDHNLKLFGRGDSTKTTNRNSFIFGGTLLKGFSLGYVFDKAKTCSNVKVLSAPTIVTTHNREASIKVGESRPVITANFTDLTNQRSIRNSVNYKDIGIELTVTPLIGPNGVIQMRIDQLIQKIGGDVQIDGNNQPIIAKRQAVSFVSVHDGDVVVLAGLQEKEYTDSRSKLWLLGHIPILGEALFSPKTRIEKTNELLIFIRPSIVANPSSEEEYAQRALKNSSLNSDLDTYRSKGRFMLKGKSEPKLGEPSNQKPKRRRMRAI
ncbi:MAG: hypothetical protein LBF42_00090 [Puniceicoccales bacterium]|jgi:general secretion pathway protein D|nr:hypothetical protein [Puniceicoccales bacterium]